MNDISNEVLELLVKIKRGQPGDSLSGGEAVEGGSDEDKVFVEAQQLGLIERVAGQGPRWEYSYRLTRAGDELLRNRGR